MENNKKKELKQSNEKYQLQITLQIHKKSVMNIIILKDLRLASSSCDKSIKIFNKDTYEIEINILEHTDFVAYIYQLKDEKLISSSSDNTIKIFKLFKNSYNIEQILTGHSKPVKKTIELMNGNLVSCSWDKTIKIWKKIQNNKYIDIQQFQEKFEVQNIFEINDKEFISLSIANDSENEEKKQISFYRIKNGKFAILKTIAKKMDISGFSSNVTKISEKYILIGGKKKIYCIDIMNYSIDKIYELGKDSWCQSLSFLKNGYISVGAEINIFIFKIIDNNFKLIVKLENVQKDNENDCTAISSIQEDINNNIILALYNGEIKIFSKLE